MQQMMRSMGLAPFLFINGFLLVVAGVIIGAALHARRRAALVKLMPTSNIGMAEDGYREVEGRIDAIDGPPVMAPLTRTRCAWYHAKLERWRGGGGNRSGAWVSVREATSSAPILLRDSTGVCVVQPFLAEVTPTDKSMWTGPTEEPIDRNPPRLGPTESTTPIWSVTGGGDTKFRYTEERIYLGDPLLVLGEFSTRPLESDDEEEDDDLGDDEETGTVEGSGDGPEEDEGADSEPDEDGADGGWGKWSDFELAEELKARAAQVTQASIQRGYRGNPFIMTTTPQAQHLYLSDVGVQMALYLAVLPLGLVALLFYARYS